MRSEEDHQLARMEAYYKAALDIFGSATRTYRHIYTTWDARLLKGCSLKAFNEPVLKLDHRHIRKVRR